jgi:hypothetical protein
MAMLRRKTSRRAESGRPRFPSAGVILATLSTVVALATGMFTLRDHIFPREAGTAEAISVPVYQQQVGDICDEVNANDRRRARDDKAIKRRLERVDTTLEQRNAVLDGVRRSAARSGQTLASFGGIATPEALAVMHHATEVAWNRNLARLREYALALDNAGTRRRFLGAVEDVAQQRPAIGRDGDRVRTGLERLGADSCDLVPTRVVASYTVPPLEQDDRPGSAENPHIANPPTSTPRLPGTPQPAPTTIPQDPAGSAAVEPRANTPDSGGATAPPSANQPAPATGGGED